ncbi:EpsI family protein [Acidihalobacter yilgarnensis]|uniref:EpsI family protein n=2 Tax=Acidihalobacter yilgarnensis TaxID=2819280 RepID=A0A1D8IPV4_9GAMM|nr:EpsI family protein [Acidihalobacter yilgarnensis]
MVGVWSGDGTFQYAFFILPISVFLIYLRRTVTQGLSFHVSGYGALLVLVFSLMWAVGTIIGVQLVQQFSVIALLPALVLTVYGTSVFRALIFPLLYLFFGFPWPVAHVTTILQHITAAMSVWLLQHTGYVAYLHGVLIETEVATWHVADACSGIKFFLASLALGALYANLFYTSWRRRAAFMVAAFVVPIVANSLRVYFTVVIGEVFGVEYASGTDHLIFGWQFFGTVLVLLFGAGWFWRESPLEFATVQFPVYFGRRSSILKALPLGAVFLLCGPGMIWLSTYAAKSPATRPMINTKFDGWHVLLTQANPLGARFKRPDQVVMSTYGDGVINVNLVAVDYAGRPMHDHKLFMIGNRRYDSTQWSVQQRSHDALSGIPIPYSVHQTWLISSNAHRLMWYWYEVNGVSASGLIAVKLLQLENFVLGKPIVTRLIILSAPVRADSKSAEAALLAFTKAYWAGNHSGTAYPSQGLSG